MSGTAPLPLRSSGAGVLAAAVDGWSDDGKAPLGNVQAGGQASVVSRSPVRWHRLASATGHCWRGSRGDAIARSLAPRETNTASDLVAKVERLEALVRARAWRDSCSQILSKRVATVAPVCVGNSNWARLTSPQPLCNSGSVVGTREPSSARLAGPSKPCCMRSPVRRIAMTRQTCLDLRCEKLAVLWWRLPERERRAVLKQYARLIARAAQAQSQSSKQGAK
jgi:hypothetical protein